MRFKKLLKKTVYWFLIIIILWVGIGYLAAWLLTKAFESNTGCKIQAHAPRFTLFPIEGHIRDISIRMPHEAPHQGVWIKSLSIKLDFLELFRKRINLRNLVLRDVIINGDGIESSFIRFLAFILKDPEYSGWKVHLVDLAVNAPLNRDVAFSFTFGSITVYASEATFNIDDKNKIEDPYDANLVLKNAYVHLPKIGTIPFSTISSAGQIGANKITLINAQLAEGRTDTNNIPLKIDGTLNIHSPDFYDLRATAVAKEPAIEELPASIATIKEFISQAAFTAKVSGEWDNPHITSDASFQLNRELTVFQNTKCIPTQLDSSFDFESDTLKISNIKANDFIKNGTVEVSLANNMLYWGELSLEISPQNEFIRNCLSTQGSKFSVVSDVLLQKLNTENFLVKLSGELLNSQLHADISQLGKIDAGGLLFSINIDYKDQEFLLKVTGLRRDDMGTSNEAANVNLSYNRATLETVINEIQLKDYPAKSLARQLVPLLKEEYQGLLTEAFDEKSILNVSLSRGNVNLSGVFGLKGTAKLTNFRYADVEVNTIEGLFKPTQDNDLSFALSGSMGSGLLKLSGTLQQNYAIRSNFVAENLILQEISLWRSIFPIMVGQGNLKASIAGSLLKPVVTADILLNTNFLFEPGRNFKSNIIAEFSDDVLKLQGTLLDKSIVIDELSANIKDSIEEAKLRATLLNAPLVAFLPAKMQEKYNPALAQISEKYGAVNATIDFSGPAFSIGEGNGRIKVEILKLPGAKPFVVTDKPLEISIVKGKVIFQKVVFSNNEHEITLTGYLDQQSGWNAKLLGGWDLATVLPSLPAVEQISGQLSVDLSILGEPLAPTINGPITLKDGALSFHFRQSIIGFRGVSLMSEFRNGDIFIKDFNGKFGTGEFRGEGAWISVFERDKQRGKVDLVFTESRIEPIDHLTMISKGEIAVEKSIGEPVNLKGTILVVMADYEQNIDLATVLRSLSGFLFGERTEGTTRLISNRGTDDSQSLRLQLHLIAPANVRVKTDFVEAELKGDVIILGTVAQPRFDGQVEVISGQYGMKSNQFEISTGLIEFDEADNTLNPQLKIIGETQINSPSAQRYFVKMLITGALSEPVVDFVSNSGLSGAEIASLMGINAEIRPFKTFQSESQNELSTQKWYTLFSPLSMLGLGDRVYRLAGFSSLSLANSPSVTTGEMATKVIAVRPLSRNVSITMRSDLTENRENEVGIINMLTPYLNFDVGWQSYSATKGVESGEGALTAGFKYRKTLPGLGMLLGDESEK